MSLHGWLRGIRLFLGFLLAPAVVPLTLHAALSIIITRLGLNLTDLRAESLRLFELTFGVGMVYLCVLCFGLPYVLFMLRAGRLDFRAILLPTLVAAWVYAVVVYASLHRDFSFAGTVATACVPGVLLAGLCFYLLAVWHAPDADAGPSLLLEAYPARPTPTPQV